MGTLSGKIRETLPMVKIKIGKNIYEACTSGRLNAFCTVFLRINGIDVSYEYSWQAIARHIETGKPLTA